MSAKKAIGSRRQLSREKKEKLLKSSHSKTTVWYKGKLVMKDGKLIGKKGREWWKEKLWRKMYKGQPIGGEGKRRMDEKRKRELRSKAAIVAWTCLTPDGLGWLFYLKGLGEGRFCLIREGVLDKEEKKMNKVNWVARDQEQLGLLITTLTNGFKLNALKIQKHCLMTYQEAIEEGRKVLALKGKSDESCV